MNKSHHFSSNPNVVSNVTTVLIQQCISITLCLSLFVVFLPAGLSYAQEINVKGIIGESFIEKDVSPNQAREKALNNAKLNALRKAGIAENINAYISLYRSETNGDFTKFFNSDIQSQLQGGIEDYSIVSERIYCKNEFEIICEIIIDATIQKYKSSPDSKFQVNVQELKSVYFENDDFLMKLKSTNDCYLTLFDIFENKASLVYPRTKDSQLIKNNTVITFPFDSPPFKVNLNNDQNKPENHRLILVFTKEYYPFINVNQDFVLDSEELMKWIYSIEPENRLHQLHSFTITPK